MKNEEWTSLQTLQKLLLMQYTHKKYYTQWYANTLDNVGEMEKFLESNKLNKLLKLTQEETENLKKIYK